MSGLVDTAQANAALRPRLNNLAVFACSSDTVLV